MDTEDQSFIFVLGTCRLCVIFFVVKAGSFYYLSNNSLQCVFVYALLFLIYINNIKVLLGPLISLLQLRNGQLHSSNLFLSEDIGRGGFCLQKLGRKAQKSQNGTNACNMFFRIAKEEIDGFQLDLFPPSLPSCRCAQAFSSCCERGLLFVAMCRLLIAVASLVAEHGLQARGLQQLWLAALERRLSSCGTGAQLPCGLWDLPGPGIEPVSPALAGGFLTTAPPGKSQIYFLRRTVPAFHS